MKNSWITRLNPFLAKSLAEKDATALAAQLDAVMGEFKDSMHYEAKFFDAEGANFSGGGFIDMAGIDQIVNATTLAKIYTSETWVYIAVNAIAQTIAGLPVKLEKRQVVRRTVRNEATSTDEAVEQEHWVDASGEKLFQRFQYPNAFCSKTEFYTLLAIDLLTAGQFYIYLDSDHDITTPSEEPSFGRPRAGVAKDSPIKAMYRIPPALVRPVPAENSMDVAGYELQSDKGVYGFSEAEIIHVKLPNPMDPYSGLSPLIPAFKPVLIDRFSTEHMIRFYKSGARLGGVIETDKTLNREQLGRFQRSFENNYTGRQNHHRTLILPPGMKYEPIEQNPAQTALLEFCKYNREAVLAAYRVPPIKAGILDGSNYANARAQLKTFFKDTILPVLAFMQDGFNRKKTLMPQEHTYRLRFDTSEVEELQDDGLALANVAKGMLDSGATVNEVRKTVWKLQPIDDGDQSPVIARIHRDSMNTQIGLGLAAGEDPAALDAQSTAPAAGAGAPEAGATDAQNQAQEAIAQNQITDPALSLNGAQVQAMLSIIQQVNAGLLPRTSGIELIVAAFSVPREAAERIMGDVGAGFVPNPQVPPDSIINLDAGAPSDIKDAATGPGVDVESTAVTFADRVNHLVAEYVQAGIPLNQAVPKAIAHAKLECFDPDEDPTPPSDGTPPPSDQTPPAEGKVYGGGYTKDAATAEWKGFLEKAEPLVSKRVDGVRVFMGKLKAIVTARLGANLKSYGLHKSRDADDINEILASGEDLDQAIESYSKAVDRALVEAVQLGYGTTLMQLELGGREDKELAEAIKKYLASQVKGITDTTMDQLRGLLAEKFESGVAIGEVSKAIQEKFAEIENGRAVTIARTETLTAVSLGREMKREDVKKDFPDKTFKKMWVSAQDDHVRDSHAALDGESVGIDEAFSNGLKFPRDPAGEASEVINCRCTDITYMDEAAAAVEEELTPEDFEGGEQKDAWVCALGIEAHIKGGPGSGCHGPNCGRPSGSGRGDSTPTSEGGVTGREGEGAGTSTAPYDRPAVKPLATDSLSGGERNNFLASDTLSKDPVLMDRKGRDITQVDAQKFTRIAEAEAVRSFIPGMTATADALKSEGVQVVSMKVRAKDAASLQDKMNGKWSDKTLNQVTDGIGGRIVIADQRNADMTVAKFARVSGMKILEHRDYAANPQESGYRATHLLVRTKNGMIAEVQVKTQNQDTWAKWSHDQIYKNPSKPDLKTNPEVVKYARAVSDHLYQLDLNKPAGERPAAPQIVKDNGLEFPWGDVRDKS